jgi:hypothetical protein
MQTTEFSKTTESNWTAIAQYIDTSITIIKNQHHFKNVNDESHQLERLLLNFTSSASVTLSGSRPSTRYVCCQT